MLSAWICGYRRFDAILVISALLSILTLILTLIVSKLTGIAEAIFNRALAGLLAGVCLTREGTRLADLPCGSLQGFTQICQLSSARIWSIIERFHAHSCRAGNYPELVRALACMLTTRGYSVAQAFGADRALEQSSSFAPHVVLMGAEMDNPSGWEVSRQIKLLNPEIKVILMTTLPGFDQYTEEDKLLPILQKPLNLHTLFGILDQVDRAGSEDTSPITAC